MMENTKGFGDNSFFAGCLVSCHSQSSELSASGVDFALMGQCGPIPQFSSALPWGGLFIIMWGMAANLGGVLPSAFSVFTKVRFGFHHYRGIGHDALSKNKLSEAGMLFGHGVSSLFCRAVAVAAALHCCFPWGLLLLGAEEPLSSWSFLAGYGISFNLP